MASYKAPWQCSKQTCANITNDCEVKPTISLVSSLDQNCRAFIQIHSKRYQTLFDSGAGISCISEHIVKKFSKDPQYDPAQIAHIYGVCGEIHSVLGTINLSFLIDGFPFQHTFHVFSTLHEPVILGRDFMKKEGFQLNFQSNSITINKENTNQITISLISPDLAKTDFGKTLTSHVIPPHSEFILPLKTNKFKDGATVLCEPPQNLVKDELAGGKCLSTVVDGKIQYRLMNPTALPVFLKSNARVSVLSEINCANVTQVTDLPTSENSEASTSVNSIHTDTLTDEHYIEIAEDLGISLNDSDLTSDQKRRLLIFIGKNRKSFAKDFSELGLTNLFSHRIETGNAKPIKKAPYRQSPDMRRETERQVKEMLDHGFIEESDSPWNSPVVLVKKKNGEYRFTIDYRDLNKTTEPMSFPFPIYLTSLIPLLMLRLKFSLFLTLRVVFGKYLLIQKQLTRPLLSLINLFTLGLAYLLA
ncbi:uncharacterized protein LOC128558877 [Mercenaria mercenaria]|uniref:uncharacterized protein LOC128558877 n=1 Tax=Mercenaria mercenaria TaxID=6596 RepID=UPI00234F7EE7|nr:uncharacterized protein LOC128558877 [Mercenaria mercenaria]